jgi:hypothetical protein
VAVKCQPAPATEWNQEDIYEHRTEHAPMHVPVEKMEQSRSSREGQRWAGRWEDWKMEQMQTSIAIISEELELLEDNRPPKDPGE